MKPLSRTSKAPAGRTSYIHRQIPEVLNCSWNYSIALVGFKYLLIELLFHAGHRVGLPASSLPIREDSNRVTSKGRLEELINIKLLIELGLRCLLSNHIIKSEIPENLSIPESLEEYF